MRSDKGIVASCDEFCTGFVRLEPQSSVTHGASRLGVADLGEVFL